MNGSNANPCQSVRKVILLIANNETPAPEILMQNLIHMALCTECQQFLILNANQQQVLSIRKELQERTKNNPVFFRY
jgi:hypothetical protein